MTTLPRRTDLSPGAERTPPARRRRATEIARAATMTAGPDRRATGIRCARRPGNKPCGGHLDVGCADGELDWACPRCGDHGAIVGWEGTDADLRPVAESLGAPAGRAAISQRAHDDLLGASHEEGVLRPTAASARPLAGGGVEVDVWAESGEVCAKAARRSAERAPSRAARERLQGVADALASALASAPESATEPRKASSDGAASPADGAGESFVLRAALARIEPPIWRRVVVPAALSLAGLHDVLQAAFGWHDKHLYAFRKDGRIWSRPDPYFENPHPPTTDVALSSVLRDPGDTLRYMYDFGDSWEHHVVLEEVVGEPRPRPRCTGGARACPPEDCGGEFGYGDVLEALADPGGAAHADLREWIEPGFDPERFDLEEADARVAVAAPRPR